MTKLSIYFFEQNSKNSEQIMDTLKHTFKDLGYTISKSHETADIIASVGADGAFLQAVRKSNFRNDCLYIGIGLENRHHMYVDFNYHNLQEIREVFKDPHFEIRHYPIIEVKINDHQLNYCLNEFTIRSNLVRTMLMDIYINDFLFEHFNGDGLVISTPTGSTGYNKSLGGAIVDPLVNAMQVTEMGSVNNNSHRTLGRSFLLSRERPLSIVVDTSIEYYPIMSMDNEALTVQNIERIQVRLSDDNIKTIRLDNNTFWHKTQRNFL